MTQQEKQNLRRKWKRWFKKICQHISWLEWSNEVYRETNKISDWHRLLGAKRIFYDWLSQNYFVTTGMIVRMLAGEKRSSQKKYNTISFCILLKDMLNFYDSLPIKSRISKDDIEKDIERIGTISSPITTWVDKRVAHIDFQGRFNNLSVLDSDTFDQTLDNFIKLMEELFQKYNQLLQAHELCLFPLVIGDWQEPIKRAFSKKGRAK